MRAEDIIRKEIQLKSRNVYQKQELQDAVNIIRDLYKRSGYFSAKIKPNISTLSQNRIDVTIKIFLLLIPLNILRLVLILSIKSIIIKSGLLLSKPANRQFRSELSLLIDFEVDTIASYSDLIRCVLFLDRELVIHFAFLLIVK